MTPEYLHGDLVIGKTEQKCGEADAEYFVFNENGTFEAGRSKKAEAVGFWHIVGGAVRRSKIRTAAAVQAANQPKTQTVYVQQPATTISAHTAPAAKPSAEDRLKELDKLAAGGYITPEEYKIKKKVILDSM